MQLPTQLAARLAMYWSSVLTLVAPRKFLWICHIVWMEGTLRNVARVSASAPLRGPLLITETVGDRLRTRSGLLLRFRPW